MQTSNSQPTKGNIEREGETGSTKRLEAECAINGREQMRGRAGAWYLAQGAKIGVRMQNLLANHQHPNPENKEKKPCSTSDGFQNGEKNEK